MSDPTHERRVERIGGSGGTRTQIYTYCPCGWVTKMSSADYAEEDQRGQFHRHLQSLNHEGGQP